jgi:hypothetical protein
MIGSAELATKPARAAVPGRRAFPFLGSSIRVIGREDFIAMKCFAGGPLDLADARDVLKGAKGSIDVDLLRQLTRRFGRAAADALEQVRAPDAR